jgi:hypothetical protein
MQLRRVPRSFRQGARLASRPVGDGPEAADVMTQQKETSLLNHFRGSFWES